MDPITLIVAALAAGASTGLGDTVSESIKDAYGSLKSLIRKRLQDRADGALILDRHEQAPQTWQAPLKAELEGVGIGEDAAEVAMAQRLIELVRAGGPSPVGKYNVDASSAQGVQIGDRGTQHNAFTQRPGPT
ncbi:hypothetical protein FHX52_1717 [Humibacillus xanthopallidus]|uniref:Uncharacterized protein n=1 Tax=Humibacillus xanthopallidus TaxID=412689 RepID=A0A543PWW3_9MICO|nr:hypothetical protein [Humibacillus xanthopallidus]TQN48578.1 hypothetical protein FHX52_1717 [Humibacillus xanthopallidus]